MLIPIAGVDYYIEISGQGEPIILLHGFTGDCTTWRQLEVVLKDSFQVISIDLIGHGRTSTTANVERFSITNAASDVLSILDQLCIKQVHVLGYSMGGRLALSLAILYPDRIKSLILESASPGLKTAGERAKRIKLDEQLAQKIMENGIETFIDYWEEIPLFLTQKQLPQTIRNKIRIQRLKNHPQGLANSLKGMGTGRQPSWWERLHELAIPTLLLCGEQDKKFCEIGEAMKELLPNADFFVLRGVGHAIHVEEPEKFGTMVKTFLLNQVDN